MLLRYTRRVVGEKRKLDDNTKDDSFRKLQTRAKRLNKYTAKINES